MYFLSPDEYARSRVHMQLILSEFIKLSLMLKKVNFSDYK